MPSAKENNHKDIPNFPHYTIGAEPFLQQGHCPLTAHTVRFFARGARTNAGRRYYSSMLTPLGEETILDTDDKAHTWVHEPITVPFQ